MVLKVVHVAQAILGRGVAIALVRVRAELIVGIVIRQPARISRQRRKLPLLNTP